jgi:MFS family permease
MSGTKTLSAMPIVLLALMGTLANVAHGGGRVTLSLLSLQLGANALGVGMLIALYAFGPLMLAIYAGKVIDRVGARRPMMAGSGGIALMLLVLASLQNMWVIYSASFVLGLCFMTFFVAVQGVTGALGRPEDRTRNYSLLAVGFSVSGFIGPLVAGFSIDHLGYASALRILACFAVLPVIVLWLKPSLVPHKPRAAEAAGGHSAFDLWRTPALRGVFITGGFISAGWDLYTFYLPVYGRSIDLSASVIGMILATFAAATCVIRLFLAAMVKRGSEARILNIALVVAGVAYFLFPFCTNAWLLAAISFLLGLAMGTGQPLSMILIYNLAPRNRSSEAAGIRVTVNHLVHVTVPLLFGAIGSAFGFYPVFALNGLMLVGGGTMNRLARAKKPADDDVRTDAK